jgi:hypothetical protein
MAAARAALTAGQLGKAVDLVVSPAHEYWYGKDPQRFELFRDLYQAIKNFVDESMAPWQAKLLAELYSVWPKASVDFAILRHSFAEPDTDDLITGAAEAVHVAESRTGFSASEPVALSQGRHWLKLWNLETGEIIRVEPQELEVLGRASIREKIATNNPPFAST